VRAVATTSRYWAPLAAGLLALVLAGFAGPVLSWILIVASFGLILDGVTKLWERAGSTGNLTTHRQ
jgi:hypothetical protein